MAEETKNMTGEQLILNEVAALRKSIETENAEVKKTLADTTKSAAEKESAVREYNQRTDARLTAIEENLKKLSISLPGAENTDKKKFDIAKALSSITKSNSKRFPGMSEKEIWKGAEYERDIMNETTKAMSSVIGADGGYLVPQEVLGEIIPMLRSMTAVDKVGARVVPFTAGSASIRKHTSTATSYWVGESQAASDTKPGFGMLQMTPKKIMTLVYVPNELLSSADAVKSIVIEDMVQSMALKKDYGCLLGTGGQNQPLGIITASGVAGSTIGSIAIGTDGGNATFEHIKKILAKIEEQNVSMEGVGLIMHSNVKNLLGLERISNYDLQVTGGNYVMPNNPIVNDQLLQNLIGYKIATSNQLPKNLTKGASNDCSYIIGGNWREAMIGEWGGLSIAESSENRFTTDETVLRVTTRMDFLLRHEEGFVICSDAKTTL